jgi:hypothetical protein
LNRLKFLSGQTIFICMQYSCCLYVIILPLFFLAVQLLRVLFLLFFPFSFAVQLLRVLFLFFIILPLFLCSTAAMSSFFSIFLSLFLLPVIQYLHPVRAARRLQVLGLGENSCSFYEYSYCIHIIVIALCAFFLNFLFVISGDNPVALSVLFFIFF